MTTVGLIIDMQADFFRHARLQARRAALVANTNALAAILREAGVPVIWVRQEFAPDLSDASLEVRRLGIRIVIAGTAGRRCCRNWTCRLPTRFWSRNATAPSSAPAWTTRCTSSAASGW